MSSYRNLKIRSLSIPEIDAEGAETGKYLNLEVIETLILKSTTQVYGGGVVDNEVLYFVCFEKEEGKPHKLYIINSESDNIIIKRYDHENNAFGNKSKRNQKRSLSERNSNNS